MTGSIKAKNGTINFVEEGVGGKNLVIDKLMGRNWEA